VIIRGWIGKVLKEQSGARMKRGTTESVEVIHHGIEKCDFESKQIRETEVIVGTLNIAHGRGGSGHQVLMSPEKIRHNLEVIADLFRTESSHIFALQEADLRSIWTGNINQVHCLAERAGYAASVAGAHMQRFKLCYGTALLSSVPLTNPVSITFRAERPLPPKGAVIATFYLGGDNPIPVDIVSLHLDFARAGTRYRQICELMDLLASRDNLAIVMGDFNCDWASEHSALRLIARERSLSCFDPHNNSLETFRLRGSRLDWILISKELEFVDYRVLSALVSDHRPVIATIRRRSGE
jgi:endonuclease/exonuclease/phosphatase family metal-dependent hydrolase